MSTKKNREIHDSYMASGLSRKDFAMSRGISTATLAYHLKRAGIASAVQGEGFTELGTAVGGGAIVVTAPNGTVIEIPL